MEEFFVLLVLLVFGWISEVDSAISLDIIKKLERSKCEIVFVGNTPPSYTLKTKRLTAWFPWERVNSKIVSLKNSEAIIFEPNITQCRQTMEYIEGIIYNQTKESHKIYLPTTVIKLNSKIANFSTECMNIIRSSKIHLRLDSHAFIVEGESHKDFKVYGMYTVGNSTAIEIRLIEDTTAVIASVSRRQNLTRAIFPVLFFPGYAVNAQWKFNPDGTRIFKQDIAHDVFATLKQTLNFSYTMVTGRRRKGDNSIWHEIHRKFHSTNIELCLWSLTYRKERFHAHDFLHSFSKYNARAFMRRSTEPEYDHILSEPVPNYLSWIIFGLYVMLFFATLLLIYIDPTDYSNENMYSFVFLWLISTLCSQGWYTIPIKSSYRILMIAGLFCGYILYTLYLTTLISILSVPKGLPKTIDELEKNNFKILVDVALPSRLTNKYIPSECFLTNISDDHKTAYVAYSDRFLEKYAVNDSNLMCEEIYSIPVIESAFKITFAIRKGSEYKKLFNYRILRQLETGVTWRNDRKHAKLATFECESDWRIKADALDPGELLQAYYIFIIGSVFSFLVLVYEYCRHKYKCKK